jgi:hypothetical protein
LDTIKEKPIIIKPIPLGRLKIDESVLNKFTQSKPSMPSKIDMPSISALQPKPVSDYFKAPPVVEIPKKQDSKVKRLVTSIENRRMGEEDILARQIEAQKVEATRQRQQAKIDYFNQQSEEISYNPLSEKMRYPEVEGIPLVEASANIKVPKPRKPLTEEQRQIQNAKARERYAKKKQEELMPEVIPLEEE